METLTQTTATQILDLPTFFTFGKYKGQKISGVNDKNYLNWVINNLNDKYSLQVSCRIQLEKIENQEKSQALVEDTTEKVVLKYKKIAFPCGKYYNDIIENCRDTYYMNYFIKEFSDLYPTATKECQERIDYMKKNNIKSK